MYALYIVSKSLPWRFFSVLVLFFSFLGLNVKAHPILFGLMSVRYSDCI